MTDKYEEFKEWVKEQPYILKIVESVGYTKYETNIDYADIFEAFEKDCKEKEKEKEIKDIINSNLEERDKVTTHDNFGINCLRMSVVNDIYDELKAKDLIK